MDGSGNGGDRVFGCRRRQQLGLLDAKYAAADGAVLWERRYDSPVKGDDRALALVLDGRGNAVVAGYSYNGSGAED